MSITSVVNDTVTSVSVLNAQKPLPPTITNYSVGGVDDTALDPAGGQTVQINGTGFLAGATITFDGSAVPVVTYVNSNQLTFTSPAKSAGTYTIYVVNPDGGTAIYIPGIIYSVLPTWTTGAGTLGSYYETQSISNTVVASGDAPITYSLYSGSLPTGSTLSSGGVITGTAPVDNSSTTYSFTIEAIDAQLQSSTRSFSLTINTDVVTWVSPANATTYTSAVDSAIANVTLSATDAAGYAVTYTANALPTGLSLSGANISGTPTVIADSSTLLTATAATTNRTATRTINWSITVANDPYFEYNTLLIPGASTTFVDDASTNNFAVTIAGDTKPNNSNPYTPGYYSNYFDGSGDYLSAPSNAVFNMSTNDFTWEAWVYPTQVTNGIGIISIGSIELYIRNSAGGSTAAYYDGSTVIVTSASAVTANQWSHIALVRSSGNLKIYLNGVGGTGVSYSSSVGSNSTCYIGVYSNLSSDIFTGYISNLRIVKGTAVYTSDFIPSTTPLTAISGTSLLTCQSNRFIDNSTNNFTLTVNGNTTVNSFDPFIPNTSYSTYGSGYFDGTGDYLSVPNNVALQLTGDFTIEFWLYLSGQSGFNQVFLSKQNASNQGYLIYYDEVAGKFIFQCTAGSITPSTSFLFKQWTHIAAVRNGNVYTLYINGVSSGTLNSATTATDSGTALEIGRNSANSSNPTIGYITDVRIVKGTAVYTTAFTPPTSPLTAISGTSLLTLQNNQSVNNSVFLDNSTNNFLVTRAGNATQGTFSPYGGNYSNYFDGSGDYLTIANNSNLSWTGNVDGSMEAWVYITSSSATGTILSKSDISGSSYPNYAMAIVTGGYLNGYVGRSGFPGTGLGGVTSATAIPLNTWAHVLFTRKYVGGSEQNQYRIFVNGVLRGFTTNESPADSRAADCVIGGTGAGVSPFSGYISNLRFFNNSIPVAYQTSSQTVGTTIFTPSTTPLVMETGTQLLTCQSNRLIDNSINNFTITKNGDVSVQRFSPFNPSSLTPTSYSGYFDGTGDYLSLSNATGLNPSTGDFTFECWVYALSTAVEWSLFEGVQNGLGVGLNASKQLTISQSYVSYLISDTVTMTTNSWIHVCAVRSGTTMSLYKNGSRVATGTNSTNFTTNSTNYIGYSGSAALPGYISNLRLVKGTAVYDPTQSTITVPTSPLTAISGTSLLTLQSTTFVDNSTNNYTITANGNSQPTIQNPFGYTSTTTNGYTTSTIGGSGYFDGTGDYLTLAANSLLTITAGPSFTMEAWIYPVTNSESTPMIASQDYGGGDNQCFQFRYNTSNNTLQFTYWTSSSRTSAVGAVTTNTITLNQWNHVAVSWTGTNLYLFINGVVGFSGAVSTIYGATNNPTSIGIMSTGNLTAYFKGYISDLRMIKGQALYTSNFVPPSLTPLSAVQNTVLLNNMTNAGIYDAAMMNDMESVGDAKLSTAVSKFGGSSMYFDGTGDCLTIPSNPVFNIGFAEFTIEMWINRSGAGTGDRFLISRSNGADFMLRWNASGVLQFYMSNNLVVSYTWAFTTNTWYHLAVVRNGPTAVAIYINGTSVATATSAANPSSTAPVLIGGYSPTSSDYFNGYIDDLRITKGYARYTSNFTPPTTPFPVY